MKSERRLSRHPDALKRTLTSPFFGLAEGPLKTRIRLALLSIQNSLPAEFAINKGDTVVQVGTPWPKTMLRYRRLVGDTGRLVIVEAMPDNQKRLQAAIDEKGFTNVHLVKGAACNENRDGHLSISPYWGDHKIDLDGIRMDNDLAPANAQMEQIPVCFLRLDDTLPELGISHIDFLSVTVNGAENEVLKGAHNLLAAAPSGARVYAKGHALDDNNNPIHLLSKATMEALNYNTKITKGEPSSTTEPSWKYRAGDLYAWKA